MTIPRTPRGRGLPRGSDTHTVSWPPALRGRPTLLCLLLLGWLGGGLLATAVAGVAQDQTDLAYGLVNTGAPLLALLLLAVAGPRDATRRSTPAQLLDEPLRLPAHAAEHADHRRPALH